jgi:YesN/AraC family two-component response regulator
MFMRVLIVDDSTIIVHRLTDLISGIEGLECIGQAKSAQDAIDVILDLKPDMIILDIRLENGNGIDVLRAIRTQKPDRVVIVLTNYPYPQYRKKCMELGANYFLDKVTDIDKLPALLSGLVQEAGGSS